jgi:hypothetical protein
LKISLPNAIQAVDDVPLLEHEFDSLGNTREDLRVDLEGLLFVDFVRHPQLAHGDFTGNGAPIGNREDLHAIGSGPIGLGYEITVGLHAV